MSFKLQKNLTVGLKSCTVMSSTLLSLINMDYTYSNQLDRTGETKVPLAETDLTKVFGKLTGEDIVKIESSLDDLGSELGFNIDFVVSEGEFFIHLCEVPVDDDRPPGDGDDDPIQEFENVDTVEAVSKPKVMSAHG